MPLAQSQRQTEQQSQLPDNETPSTPANNTEKTKQKRTRLNLNSNPHRTSITDYNSFHVTENTIAESESVIQISTCKIQQITIRKKT